VTQANDKWLVYPVDSDGHQGLDLSRACMLADTLAWAVSAGMPLPEALRSLPFYRNFGGLAPKLRKHVSAIRSSMAPFRPFFWLTNTRWAWNLRMMILDIEHGEPLSSALERNLGRHFPAFYLMGIARAEAQNRLETALPVLARQICYPASVTAERKAFYFLVIVKIMVVAQVLMFSVLNVAPKFAEISENLGGQYSGPPFSGSIAPIIHNLIGAFVLALVIIFMLSKTETLGEYLLLRLPFFSREWKRLVLADLARGMAAFIRQDEDIPGAADWNRKATRSPFVRRKLDGFIRSVNNGNNWVDAWDDMKLGSPLDQWVIRNAASREDPASGFELLAEWIQSEVTMATRRLERWLDPCCTLALAVLVALMAWWSFSCLINMINSLL
jgi:type II secretory pathway component PulF